MASAKHRRTKHHHKIKPGPVRSSAGIPYDYIVVIDAGSHGSRAHVYNWLNPQHALDVGVDISAARKVNLVKRIVGDITERNNDAHFGADSGSDSEDDPKAKDAKDAKAVRFPFIHEGKKWHRAIKPSLASFNESPQKVGKHHLRHLLSLASNVVPKSEHYRTPIYLHATAGMRLLPPNEQEPILENTCQYLKSNSDFFMPDCKSHVNVLDGTIEGLYGWISINYLVGSFDRPEEHQHGKNHTTYGLLDMGGASTQVVFQPNLTEIEEHKTNLYRLSLYTRPHLAKSTRPTNSAENSKYGLPQLVELNVFSDSFLGFGMFQAHRRYLKVLLEDFRKANKFPANAYRLRTPIFDPCLPQGYTFAAKVDDHSIEFTGNSDFQECLKSIFPVLANNTHALGIVKYNRNCQQLGKESKVSSCLLNDMMPAFDFDINHFIGVSGYWDIVDSLLSSLSLPISNNAESDKYDYNAIYKKTQQICTSLLDALLTLNNLKDKKARLKEEDLAELCFRASWILNFLHVGLGFPRFGIDEVHNQDKDDKFKSLQLVEKIGGSSFSWTLGRAVLYANDEYTQAYNNYTRRLDPMVAPLSRPGYVYTDAEGSFTYGAEVEHVASRPLFVEAQPGTKHYDDKAKYKDAYELRWTIEPHHALDLVVFVLLILVVVFFLMGKSGRSTLRKRLHKVYQSSKRKVFALLGRGSGSTYVRLEDLAPIEMSQKSSDDDDGVFRIEDEIE